MKKKLILLFNVIILAGLMAVACPNETKAAVQTMSDGQYFDPEFYAANNPDVVNAFGLDVNALYKHYVQYGKKEGRLPYAVVVTPQVPVSQTVQNNLLALQANFPEGTSWTEANVYTSSNSRPWAYSTVDACQAFAYLVQDYLFGKKTVQLWEVSPYYSGYYKNAHLYNFDAIYGALQPGDIIHTSIHSVIVLSKNESGITIVEGNARINGAPGAVHWNRFISKDELRYELQYVETAY